MLNVILLSIRIKLFMLSIIILSVAITPIVLSAAQNPNAGYSSHAHMLSSIQINAILPRLC
jgi:hypothetical protein